MPQFSRLDQLREQRPAIHCMTGDVTRQNCLQLCLLLGARPVTAHALEEVRDVTAGTDALVLCTDDPDSQRFRAAISWGQAAARARRPIVLEPVGVTRSQWRYQSVQALLHIFTPTMLHVTAAEATVLLEPQLNETCPLSPEDRERAARELARRRRTVVLLSGPEEDIVSDGSHSWRVSGGSGPAMAGEGCLRSTLCGAFAAVEENPLEAALLASAFWHVCAGKAGQAGPGSFPAAFLDAAAGLTAQQLADGATIAEW